MRKISLVLILIISNAAFSEDDPVTGLKIAPGWELIRMHCGACHSYKLVTSQRADREGWHDMIKWMQKTQNLWKFDPVIESQILDYLSSTYSSTENLRRQPIIDSLMPIEK
tara:strand:- start:660 stop:992 length:333 start_codon:yes stop_codon:yes gene_type:complete